MRGIYRHITNHIGNITPHSFLICAMAAILFSFAAPNAIVLAATAFQGSLQSVSIADAIGTNTPPAAKFTYTINGNTVTFDGSSSVDSDGNITEYKWDFGDGTGASGSTASHTFATLTDVRVSLTIKDNNGSVSIVQHPVTSQTPLNIAINFQPYDVAIPTGFLVDSGDSYSDQRGYGWVSLPNSLGTRDRNNALSPDQSYDTFIHLSPTAVWQYKLANGTYKVTVVMGDPTYPDTTQAMQIENQVVIPPTALSPTQPWIEKQATIEVKDQNLTVSFTGSTVGKLCWIKISNI